MSEKEKDKEKKHKPEGAHPKGEKGGGGEISFGLVRVAEHPIDEIR